MAVPKRATTVALVKFKVGSCALLAVNLCFFICVAQCCRLIHPISGIWDKKGEVNVKLFERVFGQTELTPLP